jgi:hypothetical protein
MQGNLIKELTDQKAGMGKTDAPKWTGRSVQVNN